MKHKAILKMRNGIGYQLKETGKDYLLELDNVIYHTNPLAQGIGKFGKLSYKNCQEIERSYDLVELAESLQKTEWDVEVVMEDNSESDDIEVVNIPKPKLDADGSLILKFPKSSIQRVALW